jgi:hypothetical protein
MQQASPRIAPLSPDEFSDEQKRQLGGFVSMNFVRVTMRHPDLNSTFMPLLTKLVAGSNLTPSLDFSRGAVGSDDFGARRAGGLDFAEWVCRVGRCRSVGGLSRAGGVPRVGWTVAWTVRGRRPEVVAMLGKSRLPTARWRRCVAGFVGRPG